MSKYLFGFILFVFFSTVALVVWGLNDYRRIKTQMPLLAELKKENNLQKAQLIILTQRFDQISNKLVDLKNFDRKLKIMVNLDNGDNDDNPQFLGIGGSDPSDISPDYTVEKAHQKLARLLQQSLDTLNTEISIQINEKAELYEYFQQRKSLLAHTPSIC